MVWGAWKLHDSIHLKTFGCLSSEWQYCCGSRWENRGPFLYDPTYQPKVGTLCFPQKYLICSELRMSLDGFPIPCWLVNQSFISKSLISSFVSDHTHIVQTPKAMYRLSLDLSIQLFTFRSLKSIPGCYNFKTYVLSVTPSINLL